MISPATKANAGAVARHYEELDRFYREIWGEHVHHGLWLTGHESPERAVVQLVEQVARRAELRVGAAVCDVGCGYGATARLLADRYGARVTAITVTPQQAEYARNVRPGSENPTYILGDWLNNQLPAGEFDAVVAIESTEHMVDKQHAFHEAARVLKAGGRLVLCAWLAANQAARWQVHHLLEPICTEGRIPEMGTEPEYSSMLRRAGFKVRRFEDHGADVRRTWTICLLRLARGLILRPEWRRFLFDGRRENRVFARTMFRIRLAYATGAMRYGLYTADRV